MQGVLGSDHIGLKKMILRYPNGIPDFVLECWLDDSSRYLTLVNLKAISYDEYRKPETQMGYAYLLDNEFRSGLLNKDKFIY
jgi:hypothetical protein